MNKRAESIKGRKVAVLIDDGVDETMLDAITTALEEQHALFDFIAPHAGHVTAKGGASVKINKAAPNAPSVLYDAAIVPGGTRSESLVGSKLAHEFLGEAFWHGKPLAFFGEGASLREGVHLPSGADGRVGRRSRHGRLHRNDEAAPFSSLLSRDSIGPGVSEGETPASPLIFGRSS